LRGACTSGRRGKHILKNKDFQFQRAVAQIL
jgi:hypothetical protein